MLKVEYSPKALEDLKLLREYISTNFVGDVAKRIVNKITSDISRLELYPLSGVDLGKIIDIANDYRYLYSEKNYVFYRLEFDTVRIIRVLSVRQDYLRQLFGISFKSDEQYNE